MLLDLSKKRFAQVFVCFLAAASALFPAGCKRTGNAVPTDADAPIVVSVRPAVSEPTAAPLLTPVFSPTPEPTPRLSYIFLFIGDGMGDCHISAVSEALAAAGKEPLSFVDFPVHGYAHTNDADGNTTDSAAAATAIATGTKTKDGYLGIDPSKARLTTVAETLQRSGRRVGILTSVGLDHATPAGFYAHVDSRRSYFDITRDLMASRFDYFAGGAFHTTEDVSPLAAESGYAFARTKAEAELVPADTPLIWANAELLGDYGLVPAIDVGLNDGARKNLLADMLSLGLTRLTDERGFFVMVEGGRIDYFSHYHDAGSMAFELLDMDAAIRVALQFYDAHPLETLILVTADHETGKLTLSDGDRSALLSQSVSCDTFDDAFVAPWIEQKTTFEDALPTCLSLFAPGEPTEEEKAVLSEAYAHTIKGDLSEKERKSLYGVYEPITCALSELAAARAGLTFRSGAHTDVDVSVYAYGVGAEMFAGAYENAAIHDLIMQAIARYPLA